MSSEIPISKRSKWSLPEEVSVKVVHTTICEFIQRERVYAQKRLQSETKTDAYQRRLHYRTILILDRLHDHIKSYNLMSNQTQSVFSETKKEP